MLTSMTTNRLTADALHALTDLVSDVATLATISYSLRPATTRFPLGYGKIESLGALGVSGLLLSGGLMIGLQALTTLSQQFFPEIAHMISHLGILEHGHSHSHSHSSTDLGPNINAAWLAAGSIAIKEWLYRATMKVAKQKRSSVLASNAYHHRVDSLTAFVALLTICASHFLSNAAWLDPVGGLIIAGMIVQAGWVNTKTALLELADVGVEAEIRENVRKAAEKALVAEGFETSELFVRGVQGVKSGQNVLMEIEVAAPSGWSLAEMGRVEDLLRERVAEAVRGVRRVVVRFSDRDAQREAFEGDFLVKAESEDPEGGAGAKGHGHDHDHEHEHEHQHGNGKDHSHDHDHAATTANGQHIHRRK